MRGKRKKEKKEMEEGLFEEPSEPRRITPVEIQQKEFRLAMRGYHERDVDQFLDEVTEEVARLYAENKRLQEELETKGTARPDPAAASEAEALLRKAREDASRIVQEAEAKGRMTMASGGLGGGVPTPAGAGPALAGFLSREKGFLQSLAKLMQDHANAMKEDVRRVRQGAPGSVQPGRAGGPPGRGGDVPPNRGAAGGSERSPSRGASVDEGRRDPARPTPGSGESPERSYEAWRPPPPEASAQSAGTPTGGPAGPAATPETPPVQPPPYFMDEPGQRPGSATALIEASTAEAAAIEREPGNPKTTGAAPGEAELLEPAAPDPVEIAQSPGTDAPAGPIVDIRPAPVGGTAPTMLGDPHPDEPTREWTLGESGLAAEDVAARPSASPESIFADADGSFDPVDGSSMPDVAESAAASGRWLPQTEDDGSSERSLKELFWGED